jgi:hypothetical protein
MKNFYGAGKLLIGAALFASAMHGGDDIAIPLEDGSIKIGGAAFIRYGYAVVPELSFAISNSTSSFWNLTIRFDITGACKGEARRWSHSVTIALKESEATLYKEIVPMAGDLDGCVTKKVEASLVSAENSKRRVDGMAENARQKRLAAELKRNQAVADAEQKRKRAETDAQHAGAIAEERRKARAACAAVYQKTIDTKVKDLTVREEQQVRACQALGLYLPG